MSNSEMQEESYLNRKKKKQMTTVAVLLFFLAAGVWHFIQTSGKEQENRTKLMGVLNTKESETTITLVPENEDSEEQTESEKQLVVYVCGAVNEPGIYTMAEEARLYEAIALAGGFSAEADPAYHNLARTVTDGERIYILSYAETKVLTTEQQVTGETDINSSSVKKNNMININTATAEQLMELPGIGKAKAAAILEYRAGIGQFTAIEEIMNVSGIGEAMFEKIKNNIIVK